MHRRVNARYTATGGHHQGERTEQTSPAPCDATETSKAVASQDAYAAGTVVPELEEKIARLEKRLALLCRDLWESHRRDVGLVAVQGRLLREIMKLDAANELLKSGTVDAVRDAAIEHFDEFMGTPEHYIDTLTRTIALGDD